MTSFVDDSGNYLDYDGEDFTLTKQSISVLNFQIKGDVSVNFKLDKTVQNLKTLGYYGPQQINTPAFSENAINLVRNGNVSSRGFIVIQVDKGRELDCYFVAGNANWFSDFQFDIQEVDLRDFMTSTYSLWGATAIATNQTTPTTSGICYPFVDWLYNRKKHSSFLPSSIWFDAGTITSNHENTISDFYPCFYLHSLLEYVFKQAGYKLSGNLINDPLYNKTIITPNDGDIKHPDLLITQSEIYASATNQAVSAGVTTVINFVRTVGDFNRHNDTTHAYISMGLFDYDIEVVINTTVAQAYTLSGGVTSGPTPASSSVVQVITKVAGVAIGTALTAVSINGASGFTITSAYIQYRIHKTVRPSFRFSPTAILPSMKAIDFLKVVAIRYGCVVTFEEASQTISFDIIDKITQTENWSEYIQSFQSLYQYGAKNNFIRCAQPDEFKTYNTSNDTQFGEGNFQTDYDVNLDKDLYTDPFGGALDSIMPTSMQWCQPYIPMVNLTDSATYTITSISDDGSGYAQLNGAGFSVSTLNLVRVYDTNGYYSGIHIVSSQSSTAIVLGCLYVGNSTGYVYKQDVSFNSAGSRLLVINNSIPLSSIGTKSDMDIVSSDGGTFGTLLNYTYTNFAYFSKPTTGRPIDLFVESLSYGSINLTGYQDAPLLTRYRRISNMLSGPVTRARLLLPEDKFQNFNSDKWIELRTKDLNGYFWVDNILNYNDSTKEVQVDFLNG